MRESTDFPEKRCPKCAGSVDADARLCKYCAFDLSRSSLGSDASAENPRGAQKTNRERVFVMMGLSLVVLLTMGLLGLYFHKRNRAEANTTIGSSTPDSDQIMSDRAKQVEAKIVRNETLNNSDIAGLSSYELRVLRNVHFARYGRRYDSPGLGDYFNSCPWYKPSDLYNDKLISADDRANINLIIAAEGSAKQTDLNAKSNTTGNSNSQNTGVTVDTPTPEVVSSGSNSSGGGLTDSSVQSAVRSFMAAFTKGGNINVEGVQELPNQNAATADLRFVNWVCSTTNEGGLSKQNPPQLTYDRYGMPSSAFGLRLRTYNTSGLAVLKRYNDGRWVLKEVRLGSGFDTVTVSGTLSIR